MRLSTFAFALSAAFVGMSTNPASAQGVAYYAPDGVHCYGGYVSTGDRCVRLRAIMAAADITKVVGTTVVGIGASLATTTATMGLIAITPT